MASSNRRKKQNRAKAAAKHAEARRRRAATARIRAVQARLSRIYDPETSAAELAILLGEHYQGVPVAGRLASALLREGSSLARLQDAAKLIFALLMNLCPHEGRRVAVEYLARTVAYEITLCKLTAGITMKRSAELVQMPNLPDQLAKAGEAQESTSIRYVNW